MAKSKWAAKLKKGKAQWGKSKERYDEMFAGRELPEDVYVTKLQDCSFVESGDSVSIKRSFLVIEGEHKGVVVSDRLNLFHEIGAAFVRKWLRTMDVDNVEEIDIEDLEDIMVEFNNDVPVCKVRVKQGDFTNVEVLSLLDEDEVEDTGVEEPEEAGDPEDEDEQEVDLDEMDEEALRELITDQEIDPIEDLGFKSKLKFKKASEDDIRAALTEYLTDDGEENEDEEETDTEEDDELLEELKMFCGVQDIEIEDDDDIDSLKGKIEENAPYKEEDLDDEEKELLEKIELTDCIKEPVARKKAGKKPTVKRNKTSKK